jgi:hypothetical protein
MSTNAHRTLRTLMALLAILVAGFAQAESSVILYPVAPAVPVGGKLRIVLEVQAEAPTLGGGIRVDYDEALVRFDRFVFDPALLDDPQLRLQPRAGSDDATLLIAFGDYDGVSGSHTIGTLEFTALVEGSPAFSTEADDFRAGPFVDDAGGPVSFVYGGTSATIFTATLPGLGVTGLLLTGLSLSALSIGLAARRRARDRLVSSRSPSA